MDNNNNNNSPQKFQWGSDLFGGNQADTSDQFMWGQGGDACIALGTDQFMWGGWKSGTNQGLPETPQLNLPPPPSVPAPAGGGGGGIGGILGKIGGMASMATPLGIGLSAVGSVIGAIGARKAQRKAKKQAKKAKKELARQKEAWMQLDTSNPYLNMENTMEDLTINQKQSQFQREQFQQSQANILDSLRGSAGGGGVAALAQQMAQSGQLASQQASADIGRQEAANQQAERQAASRIQMMEREGDVYSRGLKKEQQETLFGMAQQEYAAKKDAETKAKQQKWDAITGGITGAADMFAGFGQ